MCEYAYLSFYLPIIIPTCVSRRKKRRKGSQRRESCFCLVIQLNEFRIINMMKVLTEHTLVCFYYTFFTVLKYGNNEFEPSFSETLKNRSYNSMEHSLKNNVLAEGLSFF